ncbi:Clp protease N-terminal domain-containing protein [Glutamicibacter sp.]|uniref:Clp protease N-terminal domain-containing protein n=1 Tax=Glutamicibacter sp. TaxID=1931995 RepID=UPI0028BDFC99|nr:Clp protease N-terminal domain-containing protein [Glutamicibacter sp.]
MANQKTPDQLKPIVEGSIDTAREDRARSVESEHLLLTVLAQEQLTATKILAAAGLDFSWWQQALERERIQSLAAAGISITDAPRIRAEHPSRPRWGASVKSCLKRGTAYSKVRGHRRMDDVDVVLGALDGRFDAVGRILNREHVDVATLRSKLLAA